VPQISPYFFLSIASYFRHESPFSRQIKKTIGLHYHTDR